MSVALQPGSVLLPGAAGSHPHVILSVPFADQQVLVVNWTTLDAECLDDACVLQPGDHPAIHHASAMAYSRAHLWRVDKIRFAMENGYLKTPPSVSAATLRRMIEGAQRSPELRLEWKTILPVVESP